MMAYQILVRDDCTEAMKRLPDGSVHSVVCDPPYHLTSIVERFGKEDAAAVKVPEGGSGVYARSSKGFMGQTWDGGDVAFRVSTWEEAYRVLKPGGHLLAFGGTRTYHRMACAIEDAGFEIRDSIHYTYGSGFPKSHDVSKGIDKAGGQSLQWFVDYVRGVCEERGIPLKDITALFPSRNGNLTGWFWNKASGSQNLTVEQFNAIKNFLGLPYADLAEAEREVVGVKRAGLGSGKTYAFTENNYSASQEVVVTAPATAAAKMWEGWGTALKPSHEVIVLARKPLEGTVAKNVLAHGTGALNIDATRVPTTDNLNGGAYSEGGREALPGDEREGAAAGVFVAGGGRLPGQFVQPEGRWPANTLLQHSPGCERVGTKQVKAAAPASGPSLVGENRSASRGKFNGVAATAHHGDENGEETVSVWECVEGCPVPVMDGQSGGDGASRYFNVFSLEPEEYAPFFYAPKAARKEREAGLEALRTEGKKVANDHPTVKSIALMEWCVKLVTPPEGVVLDPFMGSGSTGIAALRNNFNFIGMEADEHYMDIAQARIRHHGGTPEVLR